MDEFCNQFQEQFNNEINLINTQLNINNIYINIIDNILLFLFFSINSNEFQENLNNFIQPSK